VVTNESVAASELLALHTGGATPETKEHRWRRVVLASLVAARSPDRAAEVPVSLWLAGTSLVVLLIACANVATLLLARAVQRRREIAVRLALGIGRGRLVAHLVSESVLLSGVGGLIALGIAWSGGHLLQRFLLPGIAWPDSVMNSRMVAFTVGVSIGAGLLAGLIPAWLESRPDLLRSLKSGGAGGGVRRSRIQGALILAQATMSVALLIGAGLFVRSLARVRALDLGLEANRAIVAFPDFPADVSQPRHRELLQQAHERLRLLPAVENVALTTAAPFSILQTRKFSGPGGIDTLLIPSSASLYFNSVSPDYFAAMGTRLVRGRLFTASDQAPGSGVTIVSSALAKAMWQGRDPIGHCFGGGVDRSGCFRVVGIVADTRWGAVFEAQSLAYYTPLGQSDEGMYTYLVIRPRGDARLAMPALRAELLAALPGARSVELLLLQDRVDPAIRSWRVGATLFLVFGALALIVAAIGLYSVMACRVAQRRHELGVRTALGATWQDVTGLVLREGVGLVAGGIVLGLLIAVAAAPAVAPLLYHTSPRDPVVMLVVAGVLLLSAAVACAIPAWRASRVDPLEALKAD
jgi:predicted permease